MEQSIYTLFSKYLEDRCSEQEIMLLLKYFKISEDDSALKQLILAELSRKEILDSNLPDVDQRLDLIYTNVESYIKQKAKSNVRAIRLWTRVAVAAVIALTISVGGYLYLSNLKQTFEQTPIYANEIAPGKNTATLILSNGKKIILSGAINGKLTSDAGVSIAKTDDGQITYEIKDIETASNKINTLSTARGETYQVRLPDGTTVTLNAASSLKYPVSFTSLKLRKVELTGEAYFEVAKDKTHPFVVKTNGQEVEVLGTHFNINAYSDEANIKTTLLEGSVRVSGNDQQVVLQPNQQAVFSNDIQVKNVDVENEIAWKSGDFVFDSDDLESIMRKISRWYNVDVLYDEKPDKKMHFGGIVSRGKNISAVLKIMESTGQVSFKVQGRKITVMKTK
ncbi:FecR family protein [Solitalea koreensis]|uniref:FecR family protein n=1 Tax=Solitalea koreensis TaxID=543615 RepID=A0A521AFS5_9SPHI|nr:FecR family protein [Solitalea koreensis]SMO33664.1 FecR family protein [Solitalea koreensis]